MFSVDLDLSEYHTLVGRTLDELEHGIQLSVAHAAQEGAAEARRGLFKDQTGQLRKGIVARFYRATNLSAEWELFSGAAHSRYVEEGTRAHDIWPKAAYNLNGPVRSGQSRRASGRGPHEQIVGRGQALRWKDEGGEQHFARMVHHPGTPAFWFMHAGERMAESVLYSDLDHLMRVLEQVWEHAA